MCVCVLGHLRTQWRVRRGSRKRQVREVLGTQEGAECLREPGRSSRAELGVRGKPGGSAVLGLAYISGAGC